MITTDQAAQYLDQVLGVSLPLFVLQAACDIVETAEPAMTAAGYTDPQKDLMQAMAVAIVASGGAARRIASQSAPSGASRSFKHDDRALSNLRRSLADMDSAGALTEILGPDPSAGALMMVV